MPLLPILPFVLLGILRYVTCDTAIAFRVNTTIVADKVNDVLLGSEGSLEFWLKFTDDHLADNVYMGELLKLSLGTYDDQAIEEAIRFRLRFALELCINHDCYIIIPTALVTSGRWYHVALTFEAYTRVYVDGDLWLSLDNLYQTRSRYALSLANPVAPTPKNPYFGSLISVYTADVQVELAEVRLWGYARTAAEIRGWVQVSPAMADKFAGLLGVWRKVSDDGKIVNELLNQTTWRIVTDHQDDNPVPPPVFPLPQTLPFYTVNSHCTPGLPSSMCSSVMTPNDPASVTMQRLTGSVLEPFVSFWDQFGDALTSPSCKLLLPAYACQIYTPQCTKTTVELPSYVAGLNETEIAEFATHQKQFVNVSFAVPVCLTDCTRLWNECGFASLKKELSKFLLATAFIDSLVNCEPDRQHSDPGDSQARWFGLEVRGSSAPSKNLANETRYFLQNYGMLTSQCTTMPLANVTDSVQTVDAGCAYPLKRNPNRSSWKDICAVISCPIPVFSSPEEFEILKNVMTVMSAASTFSYIGLLWFFSTKPQYRTFPGSVICMYTVSKCMQCAALLLSPLAGFDNLACEPDGFGELIPAGNGANGVCTFQASLIQFFGLCSICLWFSLAVTLYAVISLRTLVILIFE